MIADASVRICLNSNSMKLMRQQLPFRRRPIEIMTFSEFERAYRHDAIAFAGCVFEPRPIDNGYLTVPVLYQSGLLKGAGCDRYTGALNAEHHCQEFMGQQESVGARAIMSNEQPSATAFFEIMKPGYRRQSVQLLRQKNVRIFRKLPQAHHPEQLYPSIYRA